jgi:hypothetical protein
MFLTRIIVIILNRKLVAMPLYRTLVHTVVVLLVIIILPLAGVYALPITISELF